MMRIRKKTLDKATENAISQAAAAGIPLAFDRYEEMVPLCGFGQMGLCCSSCSQGPCRIDPFDASNGTACGRDREGIAAASFLRTVADGAVAQASFAGAQSRAAGAIFDGLAAANEGGLDATQLLRKAIDVAGAGFEALSATGATGGVRETRVGVGAIQPDRINILMVGGIPAAQARKIAAELGSNGKVNLIAAVGVDAGVPTAGNYGSQEALLVTNAIDGVVAGKLCVAPGLLALAARQGVPVVDADRLDVATLMDGADGHFRMNAGRSLAARFSPATAMVGYGSATFGSLSSTQWERLSDSGVRGVALLGGCNNVKETQDAGIVRQASEFLRNDVLVVASGCAAIALAKAGYMDPARTASFAGKRLQGFLSALSEAAGVAAPAALAAGSCWEMPAALELAQLFQQRLKVPMAAALPEVSRPAGWASVLAIASRGVPTYVGPVVPLDGSLQGMNTLNGLLAASGGSLAGPGQVRDPEAFVNQVLGAV